MKKTNLLLALFAIILTSATNAWSAKPILANIEFAKKLGRPIIRESKDLGVALLFATDKDMEKLSKLAHDNGRCGGFELVPDVVAEKQGSMLILSTRQIDQIFESLESAKIKSNGNGGIGIKNVLTYDPKIDEAVQSVDSQGLADGINWLQGFGGRYHNSADPNRHVFELANLLTAIGDNYGLPYEVHVVEHRNTPQHSVVFRLIGTERPLETVVLGGHLDSINHQLFGNKNNAPGADDNASGSASLIEALKAMLATGVSPQRTVEFMWYAAEEIGLVGSAEIASQYATENRDVIGVLQLDMTLFPGSGEFTIASMSDFTSAWLRNQLEQINSLYIHANVVSSQCGYGCSDHASWYRQGYPTLMPFEARMSDMNRRIHTPNDILDERGSIAHSTKFAQIAVAFAMVLANSDMRQP